MLWTVVISVALLIIAALGVYAGKLLFMLKQQNERQKAAREARLANITESIETIAKAMEQQQCDLSEGAIRICRLLQLLPQPETSYRESFPHIHALFVAVSGFAVLDARKALSKQERRKQDKAREEIESQHESKVLTELPALQQISQHAKLEH